MFTRAFTLWGCSGTFPPPVWLWGYPAAYASKNLGALGCLSEHDPNNQALYPDTPEYYSTKRTLASIVFFVGRLRG